MTDEPRRPSPAQDEPRSEVGHATPEGYTAEAPAASELGEPGTPGAGMTPDVPHAADAADVEHGEAPADSVHGTAVAHAEAGEHGVLVTGSGAAAQGSSDHDGAHHDAAHDDGHGATSDDDHGHAEPRVGPIDWGAWGYAILGALAGLVVIALFFLATTRPAA